MIIQTLKALFERDLTKVINELKLYHYENNIWSIDKNIANSAGNLALHLIGNLNTYIGKELGHTQYVRDRELEFSLKNVPLAVLVAKLNETISVVKDALGTVKEEDLEKEYPILVFDDKTSTGYLLVHLATHLAYHLGQINYHRRLIDSEQ
jgi:hypothetical protein